MKKAPTIIIKTICTLFLAAAVSTIVLPPAITFAEVKDYGNGIRFDAENYAAMYPEIVEIIGNDEQSLIDHYLLIGVIEGRCAYKGQSEEEIENLKTVYAAQQTEMLATAGEAAAEETPADETAAVEMPVAATPVPETFAAQVPLPEVPVTQSSNGLVFVFLTEPILRAKDKRQRIRSTTW